MASMVSHDPRMRHENSSDAFDLPPPVRSIALPADPGAPDLNADVHRRGESGMGRAGVRDACGLPRPGGPWGHGEWRFRPRRTSRPRRGELLGHCIHFSKQWGWDVSARAGLQYRWATAVPVPRVVDCDRGPEPRRNP